MTERADGRNLLLIGTEGLGLQSLRTAVRDDPTLIPVGRLEDPDSEHDGPEPHLVVMDTSALDSDVAVSSVAKAVLRWPRAGVLAIAASAEPQLVRSVLDAGAQSVMLRDADQDDVRAAVAAAAEGRGLIDVDVVRPTIDLYAVLLAESRRRDRAVIESLAAAVEAKDSVTSRHLRRVSRLATQLAELVDPEIGRTEEFLFGCLLHDVGKIGVPEDILSKPGPLTEDEWEIMRRHPQIGARVVPTARAVGGRRRRRPLPPRAVGRRRLPAGPERGRHPARRPDLLRVRRARGDDGHAPVPRRAALLGRVRAGPLGGRDAVRSRDRPDPRAWRFQRGHRPGRPHGRPAGPRPAPPVLAGRVGRIPP